MTADNSLHKGNLPIAVQTTTTTTTQAAPTGGYVKIDINNYIISSNDLAGAANAAQVKPHIHMQKPVNLEKPGATTV